MKNQDRPQQAKYCRELAARLNIEYSKTVIRQLKSELLPIITEALTHAKNYSRVETIDCLTKLSEKLLLEV